MCVLVSVDSGRVLFVIRLRSSTRRFGEVVTATALTARHALMVSVTSIASSGLIHDVCKPMP